MCNIAAVLCVQGLVCRVFIELFIGFFLYNINNALCMGGLIVLYGDVSVAIIV